MPVFGIAYRREYASDAHRGATVAPQHTCFIHLVRPCRLTRGLPLPSLLTAGVATECKYYSGCVRLSVFLLVPLTNFFFLTALEGLVYEYLFLFLFLIVDIDVLKSAKKKHHLKLHTQQKKPL